jgi:hypothetical protein
VCKVGCSACFLEMAAGTFILLMCFCLCVVLLVYIYIYIHIYMYACMYMVCRNLCSALRWFTQRVTDLQPVAAVRYNTYLASTLKFYCWITERQVLSISGGIWELKVMFIFTSYSRCLHLFLFWTVWITFCVCFAPIGTEL